MYQDTKCRWIRVTLKILIDTQALYWKSHYFKRFWFNFFTVSNFFFPKIIWQTSELHYHYLLLFSIKMSPFISLYAICFTIFQVSLSDSVPRYSTNVAKPSFSHKSSHHFIVTRLPNHCKDTNISVQNIWNYMYRYLVHR